MKELIIIAALIAVYLYMIMPRLLHRPDMLPMRERFYAHRGVFDNDSDAPENSLEAFARAIKAGCGIEFDIHLSKDGIPVVFHDFRLKRVTGEEGCVEDYTLAQLQTFHLFHSQQTIPTLQQVLDLVHGQVPLLIEYKTENLNVDVCPKSEELLSRYQGVYCIESFNPLALLWYRRNKPGIVRGQLSDGFLHFREFRKLHKFPFSFLLENLMTNCISRPDFVAYNIRYKNNISRRLYRNLFRGKSAAWTIKNGDQLEKAVRSFDVFIFDSFVPDRL